MPLMLMSFQFTGGLSYLSDKYGLACDNVVNFEVVLADGTVVNANNDEHSDLFWALKGGSNNFGASIPSHAHPARC
jgi:FAD/FMN-containing dehydrogenase